ncbi:MscL family protein [Cyclobacterium amurskyense]|uniref:MscL family protein n=1 Tax=Cyclobacterium amurskyense TaxID=320787 RepID=UPI001F0B0B95|nr:MscL family protein [Cyclobacterium amurskyense]
MNWLLFFPAIFIEILLYLPVFAVTGNMIDIAIGVIIGAAFNKVVNVLVNPKYAIDNLLRA